jgi:hypothetical protein
MLSICIQKYRLSSLEALSRLFCLHHSCLREANSHSSVKKLFMICECKGLLLKKMAVFWDILPSNVGDIKRNLLLPSLGWWFISQCVRTYQTTQCSIQEGSHSHSCSCENLGSHQSLVSSKEPATGSFPVPDESSSHSLMFLRYTLILFFHLFFTF